VAADANRIGHLGSLTQLHLDALNAIVSGRSDLMWRLDYCRPEIDIHTAMLEITANDDTPHSAIARTQLKRRVIDWHLYHADVCP
jgi:hypothetical protein